MSTPMRYVRLTTAPDKGVNRTVGYRVIADYDEEVTGTRVIVLERPESASKPQTTRKPRRKAATPQTASNAQETASQEASNAADR